MFGAARPAQREKHVLHTPPKEHRRAAAALLQTALRSKFARRPCTLSGVQCSRQGLCITTPPHVECPCGPSPPRVTSGQHCHPPLRSLAEQSSNFRPDFGARCWTAGRKPATHCRMDAMGSRSLVARTAQLAHERPELPPPLFSATPVHLEALKPALGKCLTHDRRFAHPSHRWGRTTTAARLD